MSEPADSTRTSALLTQWAAGDRRALDELLAHLYRDIHAIAVRQLRSERRLTIPPTALVCRGGGGTASDRRALGRGPDQGLSAPLSRDSCMMGRWQRLCRRRIFNGYY